MNYVEVAPLLITGSVQSTLTYHSPSVLAEGTIVKITIGKKPTLGVVMSQARTAPSFDTKPAEVVLDEVLPSALLETVSWLSQYYATPLPLCLRLVIPSGITKKRRQVDHEPLMSSRAAQDFKLTPDQNRALEKLKSSDTTSLLHGATGSGKTLIYKELIKDTLSSGHDCLVLVPEIGLIAQMAADLDGLNEYIFTTHSQLTESERHKIWLNILQQSSPKLIIGPRSALFTPINNLGLIIIDEAHEPGYKQDVSPRYQSQTVAAHLASKHGAKLVLGSATPRVSDYYLADHRNNSVVSLGRYDKGHLADIKIIDSKDRQKFSGSSLLSSDLLTALESAIKANKQTLLYLNRRGTASLALCTQCGWQALCPVCEIPFKLHHDKEILLCHQCGRHQNLPVACPACGAPDIIYRIPGTKQVELEVLRAFPKANVARFDADNLTEETLIKRYDQLYRGEIDVLIGTQVLSRGLDLPNLQAVGVISAESELALPDFSADERCFQLLCQVTGRVGRANPGTQVIIQTAHPEHPAIIAGAAQDYTGFYNTEIKFREKLGYPPFRHLLVMVVAYASRAKAQDEATLVANEIKKKHPGVNVLGPAPCFYERRSGRFRWQLVIKSAHRPDLVAIANQYRSQRWQIDLDPINLLF